VDPTSQAPTTASAPADPPVDTRTVNLPAAVSVSSRLTATNNGGLAPSGQERSDYIASVRPEIDFARQGSGFRFSLRAAATFLGYANGTQANGVLPDLRASLKSSIVDNWLYVDGDAYVKNSEADPFGVRADELTGANRRTESGYSVAPYVERHFGANLTLLAREELGSVTNGAGAGNRLTSSRTVLRVEQKPVPFGYRAELIHLVNRVSATGGALDGRYILDTARLSGQWEWAEQVRFGPIVGEDRSDYLLSKHSDPLYGLLFEWSPSPRTRLQADVEHRYFGESAAIVFEHRTPFLAMNVAFHRQPVDSSVTLGALSPGTDVRSFLDSILTTRYPDPATRSGVVDNIVNGRGLNTQSQGTVSVVGNYPQLETSTRATLMYLGAVDTVTLALYSQTDRQLVRDDDPISAAIPATSDFRQHGASFQATHKLSPLLSAGAVVNWSKVVGLGTQQGQSSVEHNYRVSLTRNLSPRSAASAGLQRSRFVTDAVGQNSYDATLVFVGLIHRF
jgi:uncharacterized protein (PEP-CTERM system associated)